MVKKILLINSDLAKNRGDRAIAEGNIELVRQQFPGAKITGLSQFPERDKQWFGIDFLNMNFQSLNPYQTLRLCQAARKHDIVLWGGGEILKDYTNKAALWYWVIKMTLVSMANRNLYGAYQGIGPTKSAFSKKLIAYIARRCCTFIVRDKESYDKLLKWGVPANKVRHSSDPAVLPKPQKITKQLSKKLEADFDVDQTFLDDFICIGPRDWFHYKTSGILPFKYKRRLLKLVGKKIDTNSPKHELYLQQLSAMISELTKKYHTNVLLVPMHMEEGDNDLCRLLRDKSANPNMVRILNKDTLSPGELRTVISMAKAMVGFRLHSNIVGISAGIPSVNIYYVDKGRVFFDQIKQSAYAFPIEHVLDSTFVKDFMKLFKKVFDNRATIKKEINGATQNLRKSVASTFQEVFDAKK